jgi:3-oxoacyl-(acyl-carrier-protein) synthase
MSDSNIDPEKLNRAKELYFQYTPVTQIAKETGIKRSSVQYHVMRRWKQERLMAKQDLMSALIEGKEEQLSRITDYSVKALEKALKAIAVRPEPPSVVEARNIVTILDKVDQIVTKDREIDRQEKEGREEEAPTSLEEIKKSLASDPFSNLS